MTSHPTGLLSCKLKNHKDCVAVVLVVHTKVLTHAGGLLRYSALKAFVQHVAVEIEFFHSRMTTLPTEPQKHDVD